jgi:hypothetical protein
MTRIKEISGGFALLALFMAFALHPGLAASASEGRYFIRRGGVVCQNESDILKIKRTLNTMRHFAQIRTLVARGHCRMAGTRRVIVNIRASEHPSVNGAIRVRTQDKPLQTRWALREDMREVRPGLLGAPR